LKPDIKKIIIYSILTLLVLLFINDIFFSGKNKQWDLQVYYYGALAHSKGLNPYDSTKVSKLAPVNFKFVYLPAALYFFKPLNLFEYNTAAVIYSIIQVLLLLYLFVLWKKYFLEKEFDTLFLVFCFFAFNSTVLIDFVTGNISIIEQAFLWTAFYFLLKRKPALFCIFVMLISFVKIVPVVLLLLLLFTNIKDRLKYIAGSFLIFIVYILYNVIFESVLFSGFIDNLRELDYGGISNPTAYTFTREILFIINKEISLPYVFGINVIIYLLYAAVLIYFNYKAINVYKKNNPAPNYKMLLFFGICTYVLLLPRFKSYSFILLIVPAYYLLKNIKLNKYYIALLALFLLTSGSSIPGYIFLNTFWNIFWSYYPFLLCVLMYIFYYKLIKDNSPELKNI